MMKCAKHCPVCSVKVEAQFPFMVDTEEIGSFREILTTITKADNGNNTLFPNGQSLIATVCITERHQLTKTI
jgi:hypothetical protein